MKSSPLLRLLCVACLALASVMARAAIPPDNVEVRYKDPQHFTEMKRSFGVHRIHANDYLEPLKVYIVQRASRILAPGQRLDIEVTDVDRAGEYEPWRGSRFDDVRIVKDIYPPRIDLDFTLYGPDGDVLRKGHRSLRDLSFLSHNFVADQDSLRYEKSLIDMWLRKGTGKL
ncbi:DUF3016 domain-containing protein [Rhodanobacter glycinis]|uniref:DUF3016 domain-containing protein n=2 Tax=Rhodanobacter glycinis TaxID=582702 RepID=A0A502CG58_9GAMM|nr:DUF3016 domain-containing protein [Rhodanobacter glycinis]TPG10999.1 DUF3016 domain-containing protein [Rhodanobacter glycinis]TPG48488.1 DUF3016 domain-containing protein [Rhodanobacter glycinis]